MQRTRLARLGAGVVTLSLVLAACSRRFGLERRRPTASAAPSAKRGHRQDRGQPVGRRGGERRRRRSRSARERARLHGRDDRAWPRRSPGRASRPARSTSSSRTGATRTSRPALRHREGRGAGRRPQRGRPASSAGTSRHGWSTEYPDITDWENLNKYAELFKTSESGDKGQFLAGDPSFVTNDEALIDNLDLDFKVVYSRQRGRAASTAFQQARPSRRRRSSATSTTPQWVLSRDPARQGRPPAVDRGLRRGPEGGRLRLPAVRPEQDHQQRTFAETRRRRATQCIKNFSWTNERPEHGGRLHHQPGHDRATRPPRSGSPRTRPPGQAWMPAGYLTDPRSATARSGDGLRPVAASTFPAADPASEADTRRARPDIVALTRR